MKGETMDQEILVAYASKYGATREIAEKIGEVLCQAGLQVDVLPVNAVQDPVPYQAVILGSAVYVGKWHKDAEHFLRAHEQALAGRPVWIFSSGPTGEGDPLQLVDGVRLPPALQPVADRIRPRDVAVLHGFINPEKVNPIERWAVKSLVKKPFGDFRDWDAITAWARSIAAALKKDETEPWRTRVTGD
jgi:menaquinone-dependent protoporphyrinogen oxidase